MRYQHLENRNGGRIPSDATKQITQRMLLLPTFHMIFFVLKDAMKGRSRSKLMDNSLLFGCCRCIMDSCCLHNKEVITFTKIMIIDRKNYVPWNSLKSPVGLGASRLTFYCFSFEKFKGYVSVWGFMKLF